MARKTRKSKRCSSHICKLQRPKPKASGTSGGSRRLNVRVKTARGRKLSSTRWLQRQLNDPYVIAAREQGLRSRAAFKLSEIDDKYKLLKPGRCVVDLGAAPGGWSQIACQRVRCGDRGGGQVIAIDINEIEPIPGVITMQLDFDEAQAPARIKALLPEGGADVVLSDMAAPATGHKKTDHLRVMGLCELALDFAYDVLAPGGHFLAKVLQGGTERALLASMKRHFKAVHHVKPRASRADSAELYVLAMGFRGLSHQGAYHQDYEPSQSV